MYKTTDKWLNLTSDTLSCTLDDNITQLTAVARAKNNIYIIRLPVEVLMLGRQEQQSEHAAEPKQHAI